jgi:hypothetical protein
MNPSVDTHGLRYLTAGGAYVVIDKDIDKALSEGDEYRDDYKPKPFNINFTWRVTCHGCGWAEHESWDTAVRNSAQDHAETCRAVPAVGVEAPEGGTFVQALKAALDQLGDNGRDRFPGPRGWDRLLDKYWLTYTPRPDQEYQFAQFVWCLAVLWDALRRAESSSRGSDSAVMADRYRDRYAKLTEGWPR